MLRDKFTDLQEGQKRLGKDMREKLVKRLIRVIQDEELQEKLIFRPFNLKGQDFKDNKRFKDESRMEDVE